MLTNSSIKLNDVIKKINFNLFFSALFKNYETVKSFDHINEKFFP